MKKRTLSKLTRDEKGQVLMLVLILMLLGGLIVAPMLAFMGTGINIGKEVYEERMELFYAADSGVEDGLWQIKYEKLGDLITGYSEYNYSTPSDPQYYYYPGYPNSLVVNEKDVGVYLENIWIPKDITKPSSTEAQQIIEGTEDDPVKLIITGNIPEELTYQIKIFYYYDNDVDPGGAGLMVDTIGIWLPPGFEYEGNCSLADDDDTAPYSAGDDNDYCSGKAVEWDFAPVPLIDFPGGTGYPMERSFTFEFSGPAGQNPGTALSWIDTSGMESDDIDYTWDADVKVYKITSTAKDNTFDPPKQTQVEAYTARSEMRELGSAVSGDYQAIGNSLMIQSRPYPSTRYRDILLSESSTTLESITLEDIEEEGGVPPGYIPENAYVDLAYLYWSGWFEGADEDIIPPFPDRCTNFDNWIPGSSWEIYNWWWPRYFMGQGVGSDAARTLTLHAPSPGNPDGSLDLTPYLGQTVRVSWEQDANWRVDDDDCLMFQFYNEDDGWGELMTAFCDDNPPGTFSYTIPDEYITESFKMAFFLDFDSSNEYVYIDNIKISAISLPVDTTCIFKIDGTQVCFDDDGEPAEDDEEITADRYQVIDNTHYGQPHGFSYSCFKDVTKLVQEYTAVGAATYTVGSVDATDDARDEWAYAGWSLVIIYSSPETRGHQLYLYDTFLYCDHDTNLDFDRDGEPGGTISGFLVPDPIAGEGDTAIAAKMTCFVGEGDDWYEGDYYQLNSTTLDDGTDSLYDVWNGRSVGMSAQGVDVDTFYVTWGDDLLEPGDTSAQVDIYTETDIWNLVYTILSFRSSVTSGGTLSYLVRG